MSISLVTLPTRRWLGCLIVCSAAGALVACGGGGGGEAGPGTGITPPETPGDGVSTGWVAGVFRPADVHANLCAAPRTGIDPYYGQLFPDRTGSALDENLWLRSWTNDNYLWYREVLDRNPALHSTPDYFALLKTEALTPSGQPKDKFHFSYRSDEWNAISLAGEQASYGMHWVMPQVFPPRELVIVYTEPGSPATAPGAGIARGARVLRVNSIDLVNESDPERINALNNALYPAAPGISTQFTVLDAGATVPRTITLQSSVVTSSPVQNVKTFEGPNGRTVGYLQFNDHILTAEAQLAQGMDKLRKEGATELIVDLRYNSGGYLFLASQLAYMIVGERNSRDKVFERVVANDKIEASGKGTPPMPFLAVGSGGSLPTNTPLPSLDLRRVYVLTGADTCSASESLINGLQGIDIEVVKIGATTCGKPYSFYPQDNCGTTYFSIQMRNENAKGFSDYADGLPATCEVADDYEHTLGDPREARMAAALTYMKTGACPAPAAAGARLLRQPSTSARAAPLLRKPEGLRNRILLPR